MTTELDPQKPTAALLVHAYRQGIFPMHDPDTGRIEWFSPDPRAILPLDAFRTPRTLARRVRQGRFAIRSDTAFAAVMEACGPGRGEEDGTWIDDRLIAAYAELHDLGLAHTVEAWHAGELVGGLYGVHLGGAFFGESMFIRPDRGGTDASKVCLVHLVEHLRARGFRLLDTQFITGHLARFGCIEVDRGAYLERLADAIAHPVAWGWSGEKLTEGDTGAAERAGG
jgi:leucyl/phenylalanyl-tRNA--protein transferase